MDFIRTVVVFCATFIVSASSLFSSSNNGAKRSISANLDDSHCLSSFETSARTIIRTKESRAAGAVYLNETDLETFDFCLRFCCETSLCNVAVWDKQVGSCYLFDCGSPQDFKCVFDTNDQFVSGALEIDRHAFEASRWSHRANQLNELSEWNSASKLVPSRDSREQGKQACGRFEFACGSGDCIAVYDVCNDIPQCSDGSDEVGCPTTTTTTTTVNTTPKPEGFSVPSKAAPMPNNINQWGREGERYHPHFSGSVGQPQNPQAPVNGQTAFHHRGPPLVHPPQGTLRPRNPSVPGNPSGGGGGGYNYYPQYPVPQGGGYYPVVHYNAQQQGQVQGQAPSNDGQAPNQEDELPPPTGRNGTTAKVKGRVETPTKVEPNHVIRGRDDIATLLKGLKDEDFSMATPSAALFTLVIGTLLSAAVCVAVACKCRKLRKRGTKRNLASDSDYLVNGMYLS